MNSLTGVQLVGHLGRDPEGRTTQSGSTIMTLNLATSESWTGRSSGERREHTEWHRVVILAEGLGEAAARYLRRGSRVYIEGSLRTRKWQGQAGHDRLSTEVALTSFNGKLLFLDKRERANGTDGAMSDTLPPAGGPAAGGDDIPF